MEADGMKMRIAQAMQQMQTMLALQLNEDAAEACFARCVSSARSGGKLDPKQTGCLASCTAAYVSTFQVANDALKAATGGGGDGGSD